MAIKKIDPAAQHYRPEEFVGAFFRFRIGLTIPPAGNAQFGWGSVEKRFVKAIKRAEIITILNKLDVVDPTLRQVFVSL
jgi:hypothetical protein